jgi:chromosome segregation ATPase
MATINISSKLRYNYVDPEADKKAQLERINKLKTDLTSQLENLTQEKNRLILEKESLTKSIFDLNNQNATQKINLNNLLSEIKTLKYQIESLEQTQKERQRILADIESRLIQAQRDLEIELSDDQELIDRIESQKIVLHDLIEKIELYKLECSRDQQHIEDLKALIAQRIEETEELRAKISELQTLLDTLVAEITQINDDIFDIEECYKKVICEKDQIKIEIRVKENAIKELELRISALSCKILFMQKNIEEYNKQCVNLEAKEMEVKSVVMSIEIKIKMNKKDADDKDMNIKLLNEVFKNKEISIANLVLLIKEKNSLLKSLMEKKNQNNQTVTELNSQLEAKCLELKQWQEENQKDDQNINILLDEITLQNKTIEAWKLENDKHDEFIKELKKKLKVKDKEVEQIKNLLNKISGQIENFYKITKSFSVKDERKETSEKEKVKSNEALMEKYKSVEKEEKIKDENICNLIESVNVLRKTLSLLIKEKYELTTQIEIIKYETEYEERLLVHSRKIRKSYEERIEVIQTKQAEIITIEESSYFRKAQGNLKKFRDCYDNEEKETNKIFKRIDALLA